MKMFYGALLCCALVSAPSAFAKESRSNKSSGSGAHVTIRTHATTNGRLVKQHQRTAPNQTQRDNWSAKGNSNPNTGKRGTKEPVK